MRKYVVGFVCIALNACNQTPLPSAQTQFAELQERVIEAAWVDIRYSGGSLLPGSAPGTISGRIVLGPNNKAFLSLEHGDRSGSTKTIAIVCNGSQMVDLSGS